MYTNEVVMVTKWLTGHTHFPLLKGAAYICLRFLLAWLIVSFARSVIGRCNCLVLVSSFRLQKENRSNYGHHYENNFQLSVEDVWLVIG